MRVVRTPAHGKVLAPALSWGMGAHQRGWLALGQSALFPCSTTTHGQFPGPRSQCFPLETKPGFLISPLNLLRGRLLGEVENPTVWRAKPWVPGPALPHSSLDVALAVIAAICVSPK